MASQSAPRTAAIGNGVASEAILVPVFKEEDAIGDFLRELAAPAAGRRVYLLDSNSPDGTVEEATRAAAAAGLDMVVVPCPAGLALSIRCGIERTKEPLLAIIDGDGQHAPAVLPALFDSLGGDRDLVVASRYAKGSSIAGDWSGSRRLIADAVRVVLRFGGHCHGVTDPASGCFALRRSAWERIASRFETGGFKFLLDFLTISRRLNVGEVPIAFRRRTAGVSKVAFRMLWEILVSYGWSVLRGRVPRRLVGFGAVGSCATILDATITGTLHAWLGVPFWGARPCGILVGMTSNFLLNNILTFGDRQRRGHAGMARGWLLSVACQTFSALVNYGVSVSLNWIGAWWLLALAGGVAAGFGFNYLGAGRVVWRRAT